METDWSALVKAVFGPAYLMSDLVSYPDDVSTTGDRQQRYSYMTRRRCTCFPSTVAPFDHTCSVEEARPCGVTVTSFPASGSATTPLQWNGRMSATNQRVDVTVSSEAFYYKESRQVWSLS